jgi:hypothetical protein
MDQFTHKLWYFGYFILGLIINTFFPRELLVKKTKRLFFKLVYRKAKQFNLALLKSREKEIELKLAQIAEVLYSTATSHTSLCLIYKDKGFSYSIPVYDYFVSNIDRPHITQIKFETPEVQQALAWIVTPDFPGYLFYKFSSDITLDNLGSKSYQATLVFPKVVEYEILFMIHANYSNLERDLVGNIVEPTLTEYQKNRLYTLRDDIYNLL